MKKSNTILHHCEMLAWSNVYKMVSVSFWFSSGVMSGHPKITTEWFWFSFLEITNYQKWAHKVTRECYRLVENFIENQHRSPMNTENDYRVVLFLFGIQHLSNFKIFQIWYHYRLVLQFCWKSSLASYEQRTWLQIGLDFLGNSAMNRHQHGEKLHFVFLF